MRRALTSALGAVALLASTSALAAAPAAAAGTFTGSIAISSVATPVAVGSGVAVGAQATAQLQCTPGTACRWYPKVTTVPAAAVCSPRTTRSTWLGDVYDDVAGQQPQSFAPSWRETPQAAPVDRRACLYAVSTAGEALIAEAVFAVPAAPRADPRGGDLVRGAIPRSVGVRRSFGYRLSSANVPAGVDAARFRTLTRVAAKRWGLRLAGTTPRAPRSGDGQDTVGFARDVPASALGVTRIRSARYYRRGADGRPRFLYSRVVERDLSLAVGVPWHLGPGTPPEDRMDLQTVIIHELGHYAGNDHVRNCTNSPMWVGLRPGEWWWSRTNWFQFDCGDRPPVRPAAAAVAASASSAPRTAAADDARGTRRPLLVQRTVERVLLD